MLLHYEINCDIEINEMEDLRKLKPLMEMGSIKVNKSHLAKELGVSRKTVTKYLNGFEKKTTRNKPSQFDPYYTIIRELLSEDTIREKNKLFYYKRHLWQYLVDCYDMKGSESAFRRYINGKEEFENYFRQQRKVHILKKAPIRFETAPGEQAQIDWKESLTFRLKNGEEIIINIFVFILSYSRFRIYRLSLSKTQDILLHFLNECFEIIDGVPKEILTDNMKTVMDESRTEYRPGKVNVRFKAFADDYSFRVHPCMAGRANTKAKVEAPMKILDQLRCYSGDLTYSELKMKLREINERENAKFHEGYKTIPIVDLEKEKDFLSPIPNEKIRSHYHIATNTVKVNNSSMVCYRANFYSVPPEYIGKLLKLQVFDNQIHLYYSTNLVTIHDVSDKKMNYRKSHYVDIMKTTMPFNDEDIETMARENLERIGAKYENHS